MKSPVKILRRQVKWQDLYFYKKTVVLDQLTFVFCQRFLPKYGDRTVDQKETDFTENGGIRERMTAARLGRRQTQNEEIAALKAENARLKGEVASLRRELAIAKGSGAAGAADGAMGSRSSSLF